MAISFRRYVDITSGSLGGGKVKYRDLIGLLFTTNPLCPAGGRLEFDYLEDVLAFFGSKSEEYKRAAQYFGWVSKQLVIAKKIAFERWLDQDIKPSLRGLAPLPDIDAYKTITDGSFAFTVADTAYSVTGCDFSGATAYADIAAIVQAQVRKAATKAVIKQATVTFDAEGAAFTLTAGQAVAGAMLPFEPTGTGTFIGAMLGFDSAAKPVAGAGGVAESITDMLTKSIDISNNFGSFAFMGRALSVVEAKEAAMIAHDSNFRFMFCLGVKKAEAQAFYDALKGYTGVCVTLVPDAPGGDGQYHEMVPMTILAATNFRHLNGTNGYMYSEFPSLAPTVTTTAEANIFDALRVNYIGRTQQAGQTIDFYQRGLMYGDEQDVNCFTNELWLKDQIGVDIMDLQLSLAKISANQRGRIRITNALQNAVQLALANGTISEGRELTHVQRAKIAELTGDEAAFREVESKGYWLGVWIVRTTVDDRVEYSAEYLLIYAKDALIRKVSGRHALAG